VKTRYTDFVQHLEHEFEFNDDPTKQKLVRSHLRAAMPRIGLIVLSFNTLEKHVESFICEMISDRADTFGLLVMQGMHYAQKVELLKRLAEHRHAVIGSAPAKYHGLIEGLHGAAALRNRVVHADWNNTDAEGFTYLRLRVSGQRMQQEYAQLTTDSLDGVIKSLSATTQQLGEYIAELLY